MRKILVVCSQNKWRSPTAETIYRQDPRCTVRSAGLSKHSAHFLSITDLEWADLLLYMEREHLEKINKLFPNTKLPKSTNLNIPDEYIYMDPELITLLTEKIDPFLL